MHMKNDGTLDVSAEQRETIRKLEQRILDLEAKLVQRDVYEAEQRLPPEQAVLIKHLKTVEQCIDEGPVTYHYAEESYCSFCDEWEGHKRDCAWVELQLDRGSTKVMGALYDAALSENGRRAWQARPQTISNLGTAYLMNTADFQTKPFVVVDQSTATAVVTQPSPLSPPMPGLRFDPPLGTEPKPPASSEVAPPTDEDVP